MPPGAAIELILGEPGKVAAAEFAYQARQCPALALEPERQRGFDIKRAV